MWVGVPTWLCVVGLVFLSCGCRCICNVSVSFFVSLCLSPSGIYMRSGVVAGERECVGDRRCFLYCSSLVELFFWQCIFGGACAFEMWNLVLVGWCFFVGVPYVDHMESGSTFIDNIDSCVLYITRLLIVTVVLK